MANNTTNILVGAANVAVGTYSATQMTGDQLYAALRDKVTNGTGSLGAYNKSYRAWVADCDGTSANSTIVYGANSVAFRDVGLTTDGVSVNYQPDFGEVEVDQLLDAAKLFKQKMTVTVATTFAEATLQNLLDTWAQGTNTLVNNVPEASSKSLYITPGALGEAPQEKAIVFVGNAPNTNVAYKQRVYMAARAISVEASEHGLRRTEATTFPVSFRLLPDTASSYSAYGRIADIA